VVGTQLLFTIGDLMARANTSSVLSSAFVPPWHVSFA